MAIDTVAARSKRRRLPSVDVPQVQDDELRRSLESLKEHLRMYEGDSGAPKERFVTIQELELAGLIGTKVQGNFALIDKVLGGDVTQGQQAGGTVIINEGGVGGGGANTLRDLTDTNVAGAQAGSFLQLSGGKWTGTRLFGIPNVWTARQTFRNCLRIANVDSGWVDFCHDGTYLNVTSDATTGVALENDLGLNWYNTFSSAVELVNFASGAQAVGTLIFFLGDFTNNNDVARSTDGGLTYTLYDWGTSRRPSGAGSLMYSTADDKWLWMGTFVSGGGAIGMTSVDDGLTWSPLIPTGTAGVDFPTISANGWAAYIPELDRVLYGDSAGGWWYSSMADLDTWTAATGDPASNPNSFSYSPGLGIIVATGPATNPYWSDDGGATWTAGSGVSFQLAHALWLEKYSYFLAVPGSTGTNNVWTSTDGKAWTAVTDVLGGSQNRTHMAYSPSLDRVIAAGQANGSRVIYSDDGGQTWQTPTTDLPGGTHSFIECEWDAQHEQFLVWEVSTNPDDVFVSSNGDVWAVHTQPSAVGFGIKGGEIGYSVPPSGETFYVGDPGYATKIDGTTTTVTGNLNVNGATDLDGTLNVDGITTFQSETQWNTALTKPAHNEGLLFYDQAEKTMAIYNDEADVTHQLGQEGYIRVYNNSGGTITNGQVVYASGEEGVEGRPTVGLARADAEATADVVGVATHDIENATFGYVTYWGIVNDVDTSAFNSGDTLHLSSSTAGAVTKQRPSEGTYWVQVGYVGRVNATTGSIIVDLSADLSGFFGEARRVVTSAEKGSVGTINPGQVVYITGWNISDEYVEVELADASVAATMPALGIARETITNTVPGEVVVQGEIFDHIDTSTFAIGDALYVSETAGAVTNVKPTGTALIQKIGLVSRSHASNGVVEVFGAGRSNDLPNIANNNVWVGNASGVPTETAFDHTNLASIGTNTHAQIDTHIADTVAHLPAGTITDAALRWNGTAWVESPEVLLTPDASGAVLFDNRIQVDRQTAGGSYVQVGPRDATLRGDAQDGSLYLTGEQTGVVYGFNIVAANTNSLLTIQGSTFGGATAGTGVDINLPLTANSLSLTTALDETDGGTGFDTYATGDILYASAANTLSKLAAGTDTHVLTLTAGVPTWAAPAGGGGGNVSNTGTPLNNQLAIWTDATTIEGDADLTYDGTLLRHSSTATRYRMIDEGATVDNGVWELRNDNEQFYIRALNDAATIEGQAITIDRTGTTIDDIQLLGTTTTVTGELHVTGNITEIEGASPRVNLFETGATVDEGKWRVMANGNNFYLDTLNDAESVAVPLIEVTRTGTVGDEFRLKQGLDLRVYDTTDADYIQLTHTGANGTITTSGVGGGALQLSAANDLIQFTGGPNVRVEGAGNILQVRDGGAFRVVDSGNTDYVDFSHDGTYFNIVSVTTDAYRFQDADVWILDGQPLRIYDAGNTDYAVFSHDGTDFNTTFTNTTDWNLGSGTTTVRIESSGGLRVRNGGYLYINTGDNLTNSYYIQPGATSANDTTIVAAAGIQTQVASGKVFSVLEGGTNKFTIDHANDLAWVRDGYKLRISDSADTDYADFSHDGTDFNTTFTNTGRWNITSSGAANYLRLISSDVGYYTEIKAHFADKAFSINVGGTEILSTSGFADADTLQMGVLGFLDAFQIDTSGGIDMPYGRVTQGSETLAYLSEVTAARLSHQATLTTTGWYRIGSNTSAGGRGSATFYLSNTGGTAGPAPIMFRVSKSYGGATNADMCITVLSSEQHYATGIQQLRLVWDATLSETHVEAYLVPGASSIWNVKISPDDTSSDTWAAVDFTTGNAEEHSITWDLNTDSAMTGWITDTKYAYFTKTGGLQLSNDLVTTNNVSVGTWLTKYGSGYVDQRTDTVTAGGMRFYNSANTLQGYVYHDNAQSFGLLHSSGGWGIRILPAGTAVESVPNFNALDGIDITNGATFGSVLGASTVDLSKHIALYSTNYGMNVTSSNINFVAAGVNTFSTTGTEVVTKVPVKLTAGMYEQDNSAGGRVFMPEGGFHFTASNVFTGAIQIDLPAAAYGDNDMLSFEVSVYDYALNESFKLLIHGYLQAGQLWNNESVQIIASSTTRNFTVRFGASSGTRQTVWIGELTDTWNYPQISITNFMAGYTTADVSIYADDWVIGFQATSFNSVDTTFNNNFPIAGEVLTSTGNIVANTGGYAGVNTTTTRNGYAGYSVNGGDIVLMSNGSAHGIYDDVNDKWWAIFTENGTAELYHNGSKTFQTQSDGINIADASGASTFIGFYNAGFAARNGYVQFASSSATIRSEAHGVPLNIQGEDAAGTVRNILIADPDAVTTLYGDTNVEIKCNVNDLGFYAIGGGASAMYYNGNPELQTQDGDGTSNSSGAAVKCHEGTYRDIGFNVLPTFGVNTSDTLEASHCGKMTGKTNTTAYTLTGPDSTQTANVDDFPVGGVCTVMNLGTSVDYTITDTATCTMYYCDGSAAPVDIVGTGTLAPGGVVTLYRYSATAIYIFGSGFTP